MIVSSLNKTLYSDAVALGVLLIDMLTEFKVDRDLTLCAEMSTRIMMKSLKC